jgi:hypothetical protein
MCQINQSERHIRASNTETIVGQAYYKVCIVIRCKNIKIYNEDNIVMFAAFKV